MVNILYYFNTKKNYKSEKIIADFLLIIQHNPKFESNLSRSKEAETPNKSVLQTHVSIKPGMDVFHTKNNTS